MVMLPLMLLKLKTVVFMTLLRHVTALFVSAHPFYATSVMLCSSLQALLPRWRAYSGLHGPPRKKVTSEQKPTVTSENTLRSQARQRPFQAPAQRVCPGKLQTEAGSLPLLAPVRLGG